MKKSVIRWSTVLIIVLVVYNVVVFAVPFIKSGVFFLSWVFTLVAIGAQVYVIRSAFYKGESVKSKFYGFPVAKIGAVYLIIQMALSLLFMAVGAHVALWIPLVVYVVLLGASAVGFISADAMRDEIEQQDVKLKENVACIRALQSKTASMIRLAQDEQVREGLEKFAENLRYSDPVSNDALSDIEADLTACVDELQSAVTDGDCGAVFALLDRAGSALAERNRLCKLNK